MYGFNVRLKESFGEVLAREVRARFDRVRDRLAAQ